MVFIYLVPSKCFCCCNTCLCHRRVKSSNIMPTTFLAKTHPTSFLIGSSFHRPFHKLITFLQLTNPTIKAANQRQLFMITAGVTTTNHAVKCLIFGSPDILFFKESFPPHVLNKTTVLSFYLTQYLLKFYYIWRIFTFFVIKM